VQQPVNLASTPEARHPQYGTAVSEQILICSRTGLVLTAWISAGLFGLYVLAFYAGAVVDGAMPRWNENLPGLYAPHNSMGTFGLGMHFAAGGIILALGCIQLIGAIRARFPGLHRWAGRVYVAASLFTGIGGLAFIAARGTIGGPVMSAGFSLYGILTVLCAVQTFRHARARRLALHRAWALRLFALAIGSWLYRMDYGFWLLLTNGAGHTESFSGPFDRFMAFFFYLPNLLMVEILLRGQGRAARPGARLAASAAYLAATGLVLLGTYYFTRFYWGPAILQRLTG
jgi:hypothetical protein